MKKAKLTEKQKKLDFQRFRRRQFLLKFQDVHVSLVSIAIDTSDSVQVSPERVAREIESLIVPYARRTNLIRVITFATNLNEIHWFRRISDIDTIVYQSLEIGGMTALFDATINLIGQAQNTARVLTAQRCEVNADFYLYTDGEENASRSKGIGHVVDIARTAKMREEMNINFFFRSFRDEPPPLLIEFQQKGFPIDNK